MTFMKKSKTAFSLIELSIVILIIGIIIAGVTNSSFLIDSFKNNSAQSLTKSSPISSITDIFLWAEATNDNATDLEDANDGSEISLLYDINPQVSAQFRRNLSQLDSAKPTYKTNAINGLPAIRFSHSAYMTYDGLQYSMLSPSSELTIFLVSKLIGNEETQVALYTESATQVVSLRYDSFATRFDYANSTAGKLLGNADVHNKNVITLFEKTADTQNIYINGSLDSTKASTESLNVYETSELVIGGKLGTVSLDSPATVDIGEIVIFTRALTKEEKTSIMNYLSNKWKIPITLSF